MARYRLRPGPRASIFSYDERSQQEDDINSSNRSSSSSISSNSSNGSTDGDDGVVAAPSLRVASKGRSNAENDDLRVTTKSKMKFQRQGLRERKRPAVQNNYSNGDVVVIPKDSSLRSNNSSVTSLIENDGGEDDDAAAAASGRGTVNYGKKIKAQPRRMKGKGLGAVGAQLKIYEDGVVVGDRALSLPNEANAVIVAVAAPENNDALASLNNNRLHCPPTSDHERHSPVVVASSAPSVDDDYISLPQSPQQQQPPQLPVLPSASPISLSVAFPAEGKGLVVNGSNRCENVAGGSLTTTTTTTTSTKFAKNAKNRRRKAKKGKAVFANVLRRTSKRLVHKHMKFPFAALPVRS